MIAIYTDFWLYTRMDTQYVQRAVEYRNRGCNCAQSTALAFLPLLDIEESTLYKITEGFGAGMGGYDGTCGALSGVVAVISLLKSSGTVEHVTKEETYRLTKQLYDRFLNKNGSCVCRDLKGIDTQIELRSCMGCIEDAVLLTQEILGI